MSFSAQSEKKNLKYLATLPLAIVSPSPALDIFIACRSPRVMQPAKEALWRYCERRGGGGGGEGGS